MINATRLFFQKRTSFPWVKSLPDAHKTARYLRISCLGDPVAALNAVSFLPYATSLSRDRFMKHSA
ncbi:hypothetical protein PILCRDRAFT_811076 [Piloderma croceum F 1598]|uniref:Uncharacterized protein n=1 Tax=Piloderma croceum (strain F 1598) TaxID=765440 RepID=A0A0C3GJ12_PILCF|nr:hypothetical protein PILCRDRAFT_811076 [Piloderma croceum F 1598]